MCFWQETEKRRRKPSGIRRGGRKPHPNFFLLIGGVIVGVMAVLILVGYVWTPYDTTGMSGADKFLAPCLAHPLGTDNFGRDILSRVMEGAGSTFLIALCVVLIGGIIGTVIGCLTGYFGGAADLVLMRVCDAITAFPSILLALVLINVFGMGKYQIILILGILFIPSFARGGAGGGGQGAESELCGLGPAHGGQPPADYLPAYPPQHGAGAAAHCGHRL